LIFTETDLAGAYLIDLEQLEDERGFFARAWDVNEFAERGLSTRLVQANVAFNRSAGTLRGMHYQAEPHAEAKLVRCTRGAVYDVIIDLRPHSPTHARWLAVELTAESGRMLYVPEGFAHGYQTLVGETETFYLVSEFYEPQAERGVRWDDPFFAIDWPETADRIMSDKDRKWPDFERR
jgi:dTDP-4-dehydrorhamnose 3,5-epimerase